jgi:hypothetical protein
MIRELTLQEGPLGWLVTDAFIVQNETQTTFVPEDDEAAVWTYPLPREALGARIFDDEVGPAKGPVRFTDGGIVAANPVVPGPNFYMIQYDMESVEFDVELPGEVDLARVFVREPAPAIRIEGMAAQPPTAFEGEPYLHWAAQNVRDQIIRIRLGEEAASGGILWLSVGLAFLLVAAGIWGVTRGTVPAPVGVPERGAGTSGGVPGRPGGARMRKEILVDLARLDEAYEGAGRPSGSTRERYVRHRARLLRELEEGGAPGRTR